MEPLYSFKGNGEGGSLALRVFSTFVEYEHKNYFAIVPLGPNTVVTYSKVKDSAYASIKVGDIEFHCSNKKAVYSAILEVLSTNYAAQILSDNRSLEPLKNAMKADNSTAALGLSDVASTADKVPFTNGVYIGPIEEGTSVFRFGVDGRVVSSWIEDAENPEAIALWFRFGSDYDSSGEYSVEGNDIEFATASEAGTVDYHGSFVSPTEIIVESRSRINGYEAKESYVFVEVEELG